jgi:hypothetical protein
MVASNWPGAIHNNLHREAAIHDILTDFIVHQELKMASYRRQLTAVCMYTKEHSYVSTQCLSSFSKKPKDCKYTLNQNSYKLNIGYIKSLKTSAYTKSWNLLHFGLLSFVCWCVSPHTCISTTTFLCFAEKCVLLNRRSTCLYAWERFLRQPNHLTCPKSNLTFKTHTA